MNENKANAMQTFWYGATFAAFLLVSAYLSWYSDQTDLSGLETLLVAALVTLFFAADVFIVLGLIQLLIRMFGKKNTPDAS